MIRKILMLTIYCYGVADRSGTNADAGGYA